jgi:hypothetical protein
MCFMRKARVDGVDSLVSEEASFHRVLTTATGRQNRKQDATYSR